MAYAKLTQAQIITLIAARSLSADDRKVVKKELFALVHDTFGIPHDHKLTVEIDDCTSAYYGVLRNKQNREAYPVAADGKWSGAARTTPVQPPAPVKKWFFVAREDAKDAFAELLVSNGTDFDDGDSADDLPRDLTSVSDDIRLDSDGDFWVALTEDELI